jgi:ribosome-associated protein
VQSKSRYDVVRYNDFMEINDTILIPDDELLFTFARSGGPGGQNVNKVASKAILHWNLVGNTSLPPEVRERLRAHEGNRITTEGDLVIHGQRFRDQGKNIEDCLARLREMVLRALHPPRPRRPTKPSKGSRMRRLEGKRQQSQRKVNRRKPSAEE